MENNNIYIEGDERESFLSDHEFEEFFDFQIMNPIEEDKIKLEQEKQFSNDTSDFQSDSFEVQNDIKDQGKHSINFDSENGTLSCELGRFQHLQFLCPAHPLVIETKNQDKWSRLNEAVRKFFTKKEENLSYISLSPKSEHSEIYKVIKKSKFLKQRNSYLLISVNKKAEIIKFLDNRWKNKRNTKRKLEDEKESSKKDKPNEQSKKNKTEKVQRNNDKLNKENVDLKFSNLFVDLSLVYSNQQSVVLKNQHQIPILKVSVEGEVKELEKISSVISPSCSSLDTISFVKNNDLPHYLLDSSQINQLKKKDLGDFKSSLDSDKLRKHGLVESDKDSWIDFLEKFVRLPKLCKSNPFDISGDLSQFSLSFIQFSEQLISVGKKPFDSVCLKSVSFPSLVQVLRVTNDLYLLLEKLYLLRKQIKESVDSFSCYESISKWISEEHIFRIDVSNKIKQQFEQLILLDFPLNGRFFLEEYIINYSVCGSSLLIKEDKVEILGNFDQVEDEIISPSRFFQDILSKTSLEIGRSIRFFLKSSSSSVCVSLRYFASNLDPNSQLYLHDIEFSIDQNLLPLSFLVSPIQPNQFLYLSQYYHKGNIVDNLVKKFPFKFNQSSFPNIHPSINRVLYLPQQNLTRIDYSLILDSERYITSSSSSFKQIFATLL